MKYLRFTKRFIVILVVALSLAVAVTLAIVPFSISQATIPVTLYANNRPGWVSAVDSYYEEEFFTDDTFNPGISVNSDNGYVTLSEVWWDRLVCPILFQTKTTTTWVFDQPIVAFGGNWNPNVPGGPGAGISVSVNGSWINVGEIQNYYTGQFWGFISEIPFTMVRLEPGSGCSIFSYVAETYTLDNMVYSFMQPPVADPNGTYSGVEGSPIHLNGTGSSDPYSFPLTYFWSVDSGLCTFDDPSSALPNLTCTDNGNYTVTLEVDDGYLTDSATSTVEVGNVAPLLLNVSLTPPQVNENDSVTLTGDIFDQGTADSFTLDVNWGDGSPVETFAYPAGTTGFTETHQYLDDVPSGTLSDEYTVSVTLTDDDGEEAVEVESVYELVQQPLISWYDAYVAAYWLTYQVCPGHLVTITSQEEQDTLYTLFDGDLQGKWYGGYQNYGEINPAAGWNWVTGEPWAYTNWAVGEPNDTGGDERFLIGWDGGWSWNDEANLENVTGFVVEYDCFGPYELSVTVNNVAPQLQNVAVTSPINENDSATLTGDIIDPGSLDTFTLVVNWGDGSPEETFTYPAGTTSFGELIHQYLDDDPPGTPSDEYAISLTLTDDDGGIDTYAGGGNGSKLVGYYDMLYGQGVSSQVAPITAAGHTPVQIFDLTTAELAGIDILFVQNPTFHYEPEYISNLANIQTAVNNGMVLIIHDRLVDPAETILPGGAAFNIVQDISDGTNIDVLDPSSLVANGPGGIITNTTLDGGTFSSHGFAVLGSLPGTGHFILSRSDPTEIVTFSYPFGDGSVIYSSIPLDFYLAGFNTTVVGENFRNIYAPNVLAYGASLLATPIIVTVNNVAPEVDAGPDQAVDEGILFNLSATYTDVGTLDTHTATIEWGDGTSVESAAAASGVVSGSHLYPDDALYTARVCVKDDDTAETCDTLNITVNNVAPAVGVSSDSQSVQYSDFITPVTFTATDIAADVLTAAVSPDPLFDSLTLTDNGCTLSNNTNTCTWTLSGTMDVPVGDYPIIVTVTDDEGASSVITHTVTVTYENAIIWLDGDNLIDLEVDSTDGVSPAFSLTAYVKETVPDAAAYAADPGEIGNAEVEITLAAVGPGDSPTATCTPVGVTGTGYDAVLEVVCGFDNVAVNTYHVQAKVGGDYYTGGPDENVLVVFDPSLGFTTGGGWFYWPGTADPANNYPGDKTNFGYTMKYKNDGGNVKGNFLLIRHMADGTIYRVKSNALYGLALGSIDSIGWASFSGKATYLEPGWVEPIGNHSFVVYVEDHGQTGDMVWVEVLDKDDEVITAMSFEKEALDNLIPIQGGNIIVPH